MRLLRLTYSSRYPPAREDAVVNCCDIAHSDESSLCMLIYWASHSDREYYRVKAIFSQLQKLKNTTERNYSLLYIDFLAFVRSRHWHVPMSSTYCLSVQQSGQVWMRCALQIWRSITKLYNYNVLAMHSLQSRPRVGLDCQKRSRSGLCSKLAFL